MKQKKKCVLILVLILLATISPVAGKKKIKPKKKANEIEIFFNYIDTSPTERFGVDYPVEGLQWILYDFEDNMLMSGTTLDDGIFLFAITETYENTGDGIHLVYNWQGVEVVINNMEAGITEVELSTFQINSPMMWVDLSPLSYLDVDVWYNGLFLATIGVPSSTLPMGNVIAGNYTLVSSLFADYEFSIDIDNPSNMYTEDIIVTAKFPLISRGLGLGDFIFFMIIMEVIT